MGNILRRRGYGEAPDSANSEPSPFHGYGVAKNSMEDGGVAMVSIRPENSGNTQSEDQQDQEDNENEDEDEENPFSPRTKRSVTVKESRKALAVLW